MKQKPSDLLSVEETADLLGVGQSTIRRWLRERRPLRGVKIGKRWLISARSVNLLLAPILATPPVSSN